MSTPQPRLAYSVREVCELLNISKGTVWNLIHRKQLKIVHVGRIARVPAAEVQRLLSGGTPDAA